MFVQVCVDNPDCSNTLSYQTSYSIFQRLVGILLVISHPVKDKVTGLVCLSCS
jgi:hypothetical protein